MTEFLWLIVPYVCLAIFEVGHVWRSKYDKFGWTTRSSQLYESRLLRIGTVPPRHAVGCGQALHRTGHPETLDRPVHQRARLPSGRGVRRAPRRIRHPGQLGHSDLPAIAPWAPSSQPPHEGTK